MKSISGILDCRECLLLYQSQLPPTSSIIVATTAHSEIVGDIRLLPADISPVKSSGVAEVPLTLLCHLPMPMGNQSGPQAEAKANLGMC
jgi:hypothetical protein